MPSGRNFDDLMRFFFSSRRRHTRCSRDWSSDVCSSDLFVPVAFLGGLAGRLYQQFAVTVTTAVVISGVVALTLTPALCALLLKPSHEESRIFRPFNRGFAWLVSLYTKGVRWVANHALIALGIFALVI